MARPSPLNPIGYLIGRQYASGCVPVGRVRNDLFTRRFASASNLFRKDLLSHYGCVNAIEFSNEGELLISGGDDRRVLLWSVPHAILDRGQPEVMLTPHLSNIFCLGFDSINSKIYSAGNDDQVIVHDLRTGYLLTNFLHEKPVYGLSVSPQNDYVFASAGEDGRILVYDIREPSTTDPLCLAKYKTAFHAVMFNPADPRFVASANTEEGIALWDNRKPKEPVLRYGNGARQNSGMSVRFNSSGTELLALRRRLPPVLYRVDSEKPVCQFYHPDYYNSCTMKSCSFAGENDEYVLSGSDDFNLYMWKIPKDDSEWGTVHMVLLGHRSIVNQVRYNRQNNLIASSGVEKMVKLWSTLSVGGWKGSLLQQTVEKARQVFSHEEYISLVHNNGQLVSHDYSHQSTQEDSRMMAFFDSLVQREIEGWVMSDETYSSGSDYDSSSNVNYLSQVPPDSHRSFSSDKKGNRIAQLIYEKREKLAKMAQQKYSDSSQRCKKREKQRKRKSSSSKLKSSCLKLSSKKSTSSPSSSSTTSHSRKSSGKHHHHHHHHNTNNHNNNKQLLPNPPETNRRQFQQHKHKYKTRSNCARERELEVQTSDSLDVPSTSTGITRTTSSVFRIYDQDSDEDVTNNHNNNCPENEEVEVEQQQLINILPTPLNGTHDMYINILQVPVTNGNNSASNNNVITVRNESFSDIDNGNTSVDEDEVEESATPVKPQPQQQHREYSCETLTPDSGIVSGPCSSSASVNSVCNPGTSGRHLRHHHHQLDDNSDDPDWVYESFKKQAKRARINFKQHNFGCDSDSN